MRDRRPDLQLILHRFQEGLTEVRNAKHVPGTTTEDHQTDQVASPKVNSPKGSDKATASDHFEIRASLEVLRVGRNLRKVVKGTGWRSRAVIEDVLAGNSVPPKADVRGKNYSFCVLGMSREIRKGISEFAKLGYGIGHLSTLTQNQCPVGEQWQSGPSVPIYQTAG